MRYEYSCVNAGAPSCSAKVKADTEEELRKGLLKHLRKHNVTDPNETLLAHMIAVAEEHGTGPKHAAEYHEEDTPMEAESVPRDS